MSTKKKWYQYVGNQSAIIAGIFSIIVALVALYGALYAKKADQLYANDAVESDSKKLPPYAAGNAAIKAHLDSYFRDLKKVGMTRSVESYAANISSSLDALEASFIELAKLGLYEEEYDFTLKQLATAKSLLDASFELVYYQSLLHMKLGDYKSAIDVLERAETKRLTEFEKSRLYSALGHLHIERRELSKAKFYIEKSLSYEQSNNVGLDTAISLNDLAVIEYEKRSTNSQTRTDELASAKQFLIQSLEILEQSKESTQASFKTRDAKFVKASVHINLANVLVEEGFDEEAEGLLKDTVTYLISEDRFTELAHTYFTLGGLALKRDERNDAIEFYELAVTLSRKAEDYDMLVKALSNYGNSLALACRIPEAKDALDEALDIPNQNLVNMAYASYYKALIGFKTNGVTKNSTEAMNDALMRLENIGIYAKFDEATAQEVSKSCLVANANV